MARFNPARVHFGDRPPDDAGPDAGTGDFQDDGTGLPVPMRAKAKARRVAGIREAKAVLEHLPAPGESLHAIVTARLDLTDIINALLDKCGRCDEMKIATLGYNARNLATMIDWLDTGRVKSMALVASIFFRSHNGARWEETLAAFRERGQRAACCHSHAKVVSMRFADGTAFAIEGSANLCGNGSGREQFAMFNDPALTAWHAAWIEDLVRRHEQQADKADEADRQRPD